MTWTRSSAKPVWSQKSALADCEIVMTRSRRTNPLENVGVVIPVFHRHRLGQQERDHVVHRLDDRYFRVLPHGVPAPPSEGGVEHLRVPQDGGVESGRNLLRPGGHAGLSKRGMRPDESVGIRRVFRGAKGDLAIPRRLQTDSLLQDHARHAGDLRRVVLAESQQRQVVENAR